MNLNSRLSRALTAAALAATLAGCASGPSANPQDPLEPLNRSVYRFNDGLDRAVLKPVATAYQDVTPQPVRTGVDNFFSNLRDAWSAFNALLQARPREAAENTLRFGVNTVFGLGGLLDPASEMGIPRTKLDFGVTLGRWGVPDGPYLVLPLFGPSSVRDASAMVLVDLPADALAAVDDTPTRSSLAALRVVDQRAGLLRAGRLLDEAALDPYSFLRDAYLQRRQAQTGRQPPEERYDLE